MDRVVNPVHYDPCAPEVKPHVEEVFTELRRSCPVHHFKRSETGGEEVEENPLVGARVDEMFSLLKHGDVEACLVADEVFISSQGSGPERKPPGPGRAMLVWADGADHRRSRRAVQKSFSPRAIAPLAPSLQKRTDDLIDALAAAGTADIMTDFALPLTSGMLAEYLGLSVERSGQLQEWAFAILGTSGGTDEARRRGGQAMQEIGQLVEEVREERLTAESKEDGTLDTIAILLAADGDGDPFTLGEVANAVAQLIGAGFETSATSISNGVHLLCAHPEERRKLAERPELIDTAVEEVLRYMAPVEGVFRTTSAEVELEGVQLPPGVKVRTVLASANRDEEVFTRAGEFRIDRDMSELRRHVAFGKGRHNCLGAALARIELSIALSTLFRRIPTLALDPAREPTRTSMLLLHGYASVPVTWDPESVLPRQAGA